MSFLFPGGFIGKKILNLFLSVGGSPTPPEPPVLINQTSALTDFGTTLSITVPAVQSGDSLIVGFVGNGVPTIQTFTDNLFNVYELDYQVAVAGFTFYFYRSSNILNAPTTITWTTDLSTQFFAYAWEYSNLTGLMPVEDTVSAQQIAVNGSYVTPTTDAIGAEVSVSLLYNVQLRSPVAVSPCVLLTPFSPPVIQYALSRISNAGDSTLSVDWTPEGVADVATAAVAYRGVY